MTTIAGIDIFTLRQVRDPLDEAAGWPILHPYVEIVYGSILGPTAVQMARMLDRMHRPEGQTFVDISEIAGVLGVKPSVARHGLDRLERFGVLRIAGTSIILRSHLTPLRAKAVERLPMMARTYHEITMRNRMVRSAA
jgi:hypothetical protein